MGNLGNVMSLHGSLSLQVNEVKGSSDYSELDNLPSINGVIVKGDLTSKDLHIDRGYDASYDADNEHLTLTT